MGHRQSFIPSRVLACAGSLLLAACTSNPLAEGPASPGSVSSLPGHHPGTAPAQSSVSSVRADTPAPDAAGPAGAAKILYFDYDSAVIRPEFQPVIDAHARWLAARQDRRLVVAGHTDERGGREYNMALGQQRAEAVRRAVQLLGARATQIETISWGEEKPAAGAPDETAWARNRRAELAYR